METGPDDAGQGGGLGGITDDLPSATATLDRFLHHAEHMRVGPPRVSVITLNAAIACKIKRRIRRMARGPSRPEPEPSTSNERRYDSTQNLADSE
jgi:hypothetical protein